MRLPPRWPLTAPGMTHSRPRSRPKRATIFLRGGTADELYLSVRLAVCRLLLPEDAPLLLDDALVMFDDDRLRLALRLLQREAANRQILLFTCQHREQKALTTDL